MRQGFPVTITAVNGTNIVSQINQTAETVKIQASKVDVQGVFTVGNGSVASGNLASSGVTPNRLWTSNANSSTTLSVASTAGATTVTLTALPVTTIGATFIIGSEVKVITAVNTSTKVITLNSALVSAYAINTTVYLFDGTPLSDGNRVVGSNHVTFNSGTGTNNSAEIYYIQVDLGATYRIAESRAFFYSWDSRYYYYKIKYSNRS